jgi:hypothetical protein
MDYSTAGKELSVSDVPRPKQGRRPWDILDVLVRSLSEIAARDGVARPSSGAHGPEPRGPRSKILSSASRGSGQAQDARFTSAVVQT